MVKVERITSPTNSLVKEVRKAAQHGDLTADGCCLAETFHLLEEALRSEGEIKAVLVADSALMKVETLLDARPAVRLVVLPDPLFRQLAATEAPQGVLTVIHPPTHNLPDLFGGTPLVLILDGIQDPGNAGTILRAAEAFGATGVVFLKGSVTPYNPKAVRASAGSIFRVPVALGLDGSQVRELIQNQRLPLFLAMPSAGRTVSEADFRHGCAIVVGSEGHGIDETQWTGATPVRIPTTEVESLNAAISAGILLYEASRQRGGLP